MSEMNHNNTTPHRSASSGGRRAASRTPREQGKQAGKSRKNSGGQRSTAATVLIRFLQVIGTLLLVGVVTGSFLACYAAVYIKTAIIPNATIDLSAYTMDENSVIYYYDDNGQPVEWYTLVGAENREWVDYEDIPQDLINAVIAVEDKRFYEHGGVDWYRTAGAFLNMFLSMRNTFGGSTITQQLVKNLTEYDDVTVKRKIMEIFTALDMESRYEKSDIITLYLNEIYLGNGCYGVQAAAQFYFGKDVSQLSLAECASLAGITNNPSLYSPNAPVEVVRYKCRECGVYSLYGDEPCESCGATDYDPGEVWTGLEYNKSRQERILRLMAGKEDPDIQPMITELEYENAVAEELVFTWSDQDDEEGTTPSSIYPWYVDAVIDEVIEDMVEETGLSEKLVTQRVFSGGLKIYVPYDPDVQQAVDNVFNDRSNLNYVSSTGQELQAAITIVDNRTGYVVAMAGNVGGKTVNRGWNAAVDTLRQPGSSIKPLSVYSPALEMGLITPATVTDDNPRELNGRVWPLNMPRGYRGLTTVLDGVVRSVNTIAVNVLEMVTLEESYKFMVERYGFTSLEQGRWVREQWKSDVDWSPLAMGGLTNGVSTFEMAAAYATFPRNGAYTEATTYLKVEDMDGNVILDNTPTTEYVIKESTAYYINSMLTNVVTSGTGTDARISGQTVAGKTGTTDAAYDLWFAGYTSYYTGVVWTGYPDYNEVINLRSGTSAVLWQKVMAQIHQDLPRQEFARPENVEAVSICADCGLLATADCENDLRGSRAVSINLIRSDAPTDYCVCHVPVMICTESPILDADGNPTRAFHLAGEFCPEESVKEVTMVDYDRVLVNDTVAVADYDVLMSIFESLENPNCDVHVEAEEPDPDPDVSEEPPEPGVSDDPWISDWPEPPIESEEPSLPPEPSFPEEPELPEESPTAE